MIQAEFLGSDLQPPGVTQGEVSPKSAHGYLGRKKMPLSKSHQVTTKRENTSALKGFMGVYKGCSSRVSDAHQRTGISWDL